MTWEKTRQDAKCKCPECGTVHYVVEACPHCADNPPENDDEFDEDKDAE